jgi:DNA-directed RNA polymerase specialized sigma24 family protein
MKTHRNTELHHYQGESLTVAEIARRIGVRYGTLYARLKRMEPAQAFKMKLRARRDQ